MFGSVCLAEGARSGTRYGLFSWSEEGKLPLHSRRSEAVVGQRGDGIGVSSSRPMSSMSFHEEHEEHG